MVLPYLDDAYSLARWLTGSKADAEDIVQEACVRALGALETTDVQQPRPWLLTVTRNTALTWMAKNRPRNTVSIADEGAGFTMPVDPQPLPDEALIASADRRTVQAAIAELPEAFREALVMREINGLSYRDIASACEVPIGTVMSRLARARLLLMTKLAAVT